MENPVIHTAANNPDVRTHPTNNLSLPIEKTQTAKGIVLPSLDYSIELTLECYNSLTDIIKRDKKKFRRFIKFYSRKIDSSVEDEP